MPNQIFKIYFPPIKNREFAWSEKLSFLTIFDLHANAIIHANLLLFKIKIHHIVIIILESRGRRRGHSLSRKAMEGRKELVRELSYIVENRGDNACSAEEKLRQVAAVLKEYISPSRGVTLTNKQQEVAILKLEQDRLLEESKEDRRKIADLVRSEVFDCN